MMARKAKLFSVYNVDMRHPDRNGEAADFLVVTETLQQAITFAMNEFPELDITTIRLTDEQVFYGVQ